MKRLAVGELTSEPMGGVFATAGIALPGQRGATVSAKPFASCNCGAAVRAHHSTASGFCILRIDILLGPMERSQRLISSVFSHDVVSTYRDAARLPPRSQ
jgi:hypothetical protein